MTVWVAGVGRSAWDAVVQDGVVDEAEPVLHRPVAGHDEGGDPAPADDQFVQVGRLLAGEAVQSQVVQDEQVRGQEGTEGVVHRVVDPGRSVLNTTTSPLV